MMVQICCIARVLCFVIRAIHCYVISIQKWH